VLSKLTKSFSEMFTSSITEFNDVFGLETAPISLNLFMKKKIKSFYEKKIKSFYEKK